MRPGLRPWRADAIKRELGSPTDATQSDSRSVLCTRLSAAKSISLLMKIIKIILIILLLIVSGMAGLLAVAVGNNWIGVCAIGIAIIAAALTFVALKIK